MARKKKGKTFEASPAQRGAVTRVLNRPSAKPRKGKGYSGGKSKFVGPTRQTLKTGKGGRGPLK